MAVPMITEVVVNCRCWQDGLSVVPPVEVDFIEGRVRPVVADDQEAFDAWAAQACEHPQMAAFLEDFNTWRFDHLAQSIMAATNGEFPNLVAQTLRRSRQTTTPERSQMLVNEIHQLRREQPTTPGFELIDVETGRVLLATEHHLSQTLGTIDELTGYFAAGSVRIAAERETDSADGFDFAPKTIAVFEASDFTVSPVAATGNPAKQLFLLSKASDLTVTAPEHIGQVIGDSELDLVDLIAALKIPLPPKLDTAMRGLDLTALRRLTVRYGAVPLTVCWASYFDVIEAAAEVSVATGNPIAWVGFAQLVNGDRAAMYAQLRGTGRDERGRDW